MLRWLSFRNFQTCINIDWARTFCVLPLAELISENMEKAQLYLKRILLSFMFLRSLVIERTILIKELQRSLTWSLFVFLCSIRASPQPPNSVRKQKSQFERSNSSRREILRICKWVGGGGSGGWVRRIAFLFCALINLVCTNVCRAAFPRHKIAFRCEMTPLPEVYACKIYLLEKAKGGGNAGWKNGEEWHCFQLIALNLEKLLRDCWNGLVLKIGIFRECGCSNSAGGR